MLLKDIYKRHIQRGFNLLELILVMVIVGIVAAAGVKYYIDLREEAFKTGLEAQARSFAAAIQGARADWLLKKYPSEIPTEPGSKLTVELDGTLIYINERGWPANSSAELDSSIVSQTAAECHELWIGLMAYPVPATVQGSYGGEKGEQRYHISKGETGCRYQLVNRLDDAYFFEYNLTSGKVLINPAMVN